MNKLQQHLFSTAKRFEALAAACLLLAAGQAWADVSINLKKPNGDPVSSAYSWLLEEDRTFDVIPDFTGTSASGQVTNTLSLNFHRSYMPVVASGTSATSPSIPSGLLDPAKRYFLSVMPTLPAGATGTSAKPTQGMAGVALRAGAGGAFPASLYSSLTTTTPSTTSLMHLASKSWVFAVLMCICMTQAVPTAHQVGASPLTYLATL
jgi:hypothetical protein